jgi:thiamine-phosphate pyrophosphorylase
LAAVCRQNRALFIVNDDVELAAAVAADGVHLGKDDSAFNAARRRLGPTAVIGVSCYNALENALLAQTMGADYVAFGRFFPSSSKPSAALAPPELLTRARAALHLPIVAIGGISAQNGGSLVAAGADMLAVIDGVFGQADIRAASRAISALFE